LVGRLAGIRRIVYVAQWPAFYTDWDYFRLVRNRLSESIPCRLAHKVVTFTASSRHQYILRKIVSPVKTLCIPPALFDDAVPYADGVAAVRRRHGWSADEQHVVSVGRLADQKDLDQLLHAWLHIRATIPTARLWIVGDGGEGPRLKLLAQKLGITDSCQFLGYREDGRAYIAAADVLVITSLYESFGYVALEACACGTPVVASRVDGLVDIISDRVEGFLIPPGDSNALASRVVELLRDPHLRKTMGEAGRRRAEDFRPESVYRAWRELVDDCMSSLAG
jgi:glycosyltransferase involved in cell wall biosynthesis